MSYILCFWDKSKLQLSEEIGDRLKKAIEEGNIKQFTLGKNLYMVSGIEKIITKNDAYKTYPTEYELLQTMEDEQLPKVLQIGNEQKQLEDPFN